MILAPALLAIMQILLLVVLGYVEYRLWRGTSSPTARILSLLFTGTIAWAIIRPFMFTL